MRKSNIELLRVISMIMITTGHLGYSCLELFPMDNWHIIYKAIVDWSVGVTGIGLSCFMLITGYFSYNNNSGSFRGIIKLHHQLLYYGVLTYIVGSIMGCSNEGWKNFFPIITFQYWYMTLQVIILILKPYISKMLAALTIKSHIGLAIWVWLIETGGLTLSRSMSVVGNGWVLISSYLGCFVSLFIIGNLLARLEIEKHSIYAIGSIILIPGMFLIPLGIQYLAKWTGVEALSGLAEKVLLQITPITSVIAIVMFISFIKWDLPFNKAINKLGKASIVCYLLTESKNISKFFYHSFWKCLDFEMSPIIFLIAILVGALLIFGVTCLIGIISDLLFGKITNCLCEKELQLCDKINRIIKRK